MATYYDLLNRKPLPETRTAPKPLTGAQPMIGTTVTPAQQTLGAPAPRPAIAPTVPQGGGPMALTEGPRPNIGPMIQPPVQPTGMQPLQQFGPGNDLRSTQINPVVGQRLQGVQQGTDALFKALTSGPSLQDAALERYKLFGQDQSDQRTRGIQQIGQAAARLGRLGSGMVTTDLGNLEERLGRADAQERARLASDLAFAEGGERRANLASGLGFEGSVYGQGREAREEARGERAYQSDQSRTAFEQEILRRQLAAAYEQMIRQLGLQGAALYGNQSAASQQAAGNLLAGAL